ncbi:folylpolyglutamate synthase, mitochondrial [Protobothrops mucrosquamatus]|uniref:folylpolyglutamate synthase, mitochondrial n=1 Tax=Protobothrops mucrosquamatus TaxID=103944 RepID=UPI000775B8DF|nr:folylpolyglutamate synthase, mitochondrial [Protobothrops mucrosquamatus]
MSTCLQFQDAIRTLNTLQTNASYLEQVKKERGDPQLQLQAMAGFLERTGLKVEDLNQLNVIHVTGTKGKGSACAFTERILRNYNLKTGFYRAPNLLGHETMSGFVSSSQVDLAVIEVGIGGAYDCTNIVRKPIVCGVSSLGIDHTSILGDTIEKIAWQKGGIFKPGVPAFTVPQPERSLEVLKQRAEECQCPLFLCPDLEAFEDDDKLLKLGLAGDHQRSNAALALQLSRTWLGRCGYLDAGELKDSWLTSEAPSKKVPCLAPAFKPDQPMVQGLQTAVWLGRNQVLHHGPVTWYIDGAHTTSSVQACVRWFRQAALNEDKPTDGSEVRVLLFNVTGDRDTAALLKLLLPCHFDYAVFCPNYTEVSTVGSADQQNFNVTLENVLTRCLQNQNHWNRLMEAKLTQDPWFPVLPEVGGWLKQPPLHSPPLFAASSARPLNSNSLVFPCISHALQWVTQGRDPHLPALAPQGLHPHPVASSGAVLLKEAVAIRVLVTGSLHLVGGVLKLLDPSLSQ